MNRKKSNMGDFGKASKSKRRNVRTFMEKRRLFNSRDAEKRNNLTGFSA